MLSRTNIKETKVDAYGTKSLHYDYINTVAFQNSAFQTSNPTLLFMQELSLMD